MSLFNFFKDNIKGVIKFFKTRTNKKKANITISYINDKLIVSNTGLCETTNIEIYIDEKEINKTNVFGFFSSEMDFSLLRPSNSISIKSSKNLSTKSNFKVKVRWKDKRKKINEHIDIINI